MSENTNTTNVPNNNITNVPDNNEIDKENAKELNKVKAKYWSAVAYPENMKAGWQDSIGDDLGCAYAYCIHDKDMLATYKSTSGDEATRMRKVHVHLLLAFPNTTTRATAMKIIDSLSDQGKKCCSTIQTVHSIRNAYEYLIHNTETCKKQDKYLYDANERITGNNFDIGDYEQLSTADKHKMLDELCRSVIDNNLMNFADVYMYIYSNYDITYIELMHTYSGLLERLTRGLYYKHEQYRKRIIDEHGYDPDSIPLGSPDPEKNPED